MALDEKWHKWRGYGDEKQMVSDKKARLETMVNVTVLICQHDIFFRKSESFFSEDLESVYI